MSTKNDRIRLVVVGIIAVIVASGGRAKADFTFGEPVNLGPKFNTPYVECPACISADGLELYIFSTRPGNLGYVDLWVMKRATREDDWEPAVNLGSGVNSSRLETSGCLSADGLELYFNAINRPGGYGGWDVWVSSRQTRNDDFGPAVNLGSPFNTSDIDSSPSLSADGLEFYFSSTRPGGQGTADLWVSKRSATNDPWGEPVNLGPIVNSTAVEVAAKISSDSLVLFFSGDIADPYRSGGFGLSDIWMTRRVMRGNEWNEPINLGPLVNSSSQDCGPVISHDGNTLYFGSDRPGGSGDMDLWQVSIEPVVDLNGDGIVDSVDMCIVVDNWGTDNQLCDVGPMPWGDGIVDVQDLIVLAKHLFEESGLIAYWMLDETEGDIAYDSVGGYDGTLVGDPIWQTDAGMIAGALEFDGIDDHIVTDCVLDPLDGPFSIFAWIQGGAQGEVILSQVSPMNWDLEWLLADPVTGALATDQKLTLLHKTLTSNVVITDGEWHRVGLSWNGSERKLYVDNIEVARDSQTTLATGGDGLQIGTGSKRTRNSFWSGLIDDIRIYNVALTAEEIAAMAQ